jgi:hypothetical protein
MTIPDLINGSFEALGSLFILNHCRALWKSRQADGVSLVSTVFFTGWGVWNAWFYPHLGQMLSFYGGLAICAANFIWIWMLWYIRRENKRALLPT